MKRKRDRQWLLGLILIGLTVWVWWGYLYAPLKDQIQQTEDAYARQLKKKMQFKEKLHDLSAQLSDYSGGDDGISIFSDFMGKGGSLEEFNAVIQQEVQRFLDENEISLKKYRVLRPTQWMSYPLGVLEFTIQTHHQGLVVLLKFLEELPHLVRLGRVNLNYRKSRNDNLNMTFRLETLFVDNG